MTVDIVQAGSPAAKAGLQQGDVIREANGRTVKNVLELIEITKPRAGQATEYLVEREGARLAPLSITPRDVDGAGKIGVSAMQEFVLTVMPAGEAAVMALEYPFLLTVANLEGMRELIRKRSTEGITGPVGMGKLMAQQAEKGLFDFVWILIAISVALGLFNLLPFPALDGGRLVFLGYELITRRRPNERIEAAVHAVGLLFLLGVIALVTLRDVVG